MRPWAIWMIRHRMTWLLKTFTLFSYPIFLLAYWGDAIEDVTYTLRSINIERNQQQKAKS